MVLWLLGFHKIVRYILWWWCCAREGGCIALIICSDHVFKITLSVLSGLEYADCLLSSIITDYRLLLLWSIDQQESQMDWPEAWCLLRWWIVTRTWDHEQSCHSVSPLHINIMIMSTRHNNNSNQSTIIFFLVSPINSSHLFYR